MDKKTKDIISGAVRTLLTAGVTVALLWMLFRKVNYADMMDIIRHGVNYWWILAAMGLSVVSHMIRARRWQLQLSSLGIHPPYIALCCSIFGCYALNIVFPRLGDIWRCTYIAKRQKAPLTTVLGSMVSDRLTDSVTVILMLLLTLLVAMSAINAFVDRYQVGRDIVRLISSPWLWGACAAAALAIWGVFRIWRDTPAIKRLREWGSELWQGFASVVKMKQRGEFVVLSALLWTCYYFQLYVAFFAFPFTRELCAQPGLGYGLLPCLVAFVLSAIAMGIPSNGGLGPWNIAIMFGLSLYGVSDTQGTAFSILQWSGQTLMLVILGIFTVGYILISSRRPAQPSTTSPNRFDKNFNPNL